MFGPCLGTFGYSGLCCVRSKVVFFLWLIYCLIFLLLFMGGSVFGPCFCYTLLSA